MRIALLGAGSQIAKDLILAFQADPRHDLALYGRRPEIIADWVGRLSQAHRYPVAALSAFNSSEPFDAVINFVGVANPAAAIAMGARILDVTTKIDDLAMSYLEQRPDCRYLFLSSGAAYCTSFDAPADEHTRSNIDINNPGPQDWYGLAKLIAECRHRAHSALPVTDLRIFGYFSRTQDMSARFLLTDALRSIRDGVVLHTSAEQTFRDYLNPKDFSRLVGCLLDTAPVNTALDCYTLAPIDKWTLLSAMREKFSLQYEVRAQDAAVNATGSKPHYYSLDRRAAAFGYAPSMSSLDGVLLEAAAHLGQS